MKYQPIFSVLSCLPLLLMMNKKRERLALASLRPNKLFNLWKSRDILFSLKPMVMDKPFSLTFDSTSHRHTHLDSHSTCLFAAVSAAQAKSSQVKAVSQSIFLKQQQQHN